MFFIIFNFRKIFFYELWWTGLGWLKQCMCLTILVYIQKYNKSYKTQSYIVYLKTRFRKRSYCNNKVQTRIFRHGMAERFHSWHIMSKMWIIFHHTEKCNFQLSQNKLIFQRNFSKRIFCFLFVFRATDRLQISFHRALFDISKSLSNIINGLFIV